MPRGGRRDRWADWTASISEIRGVHEEACCPHFCQKTKRFCFVSPIQRAAPDNDIRASRSTKRAPDLAQLRWQSKGMDAARGKSLISSTMAVREDKDHSRAAFAARFVSRNPLPPASFPGHHTPLPAPRVPLQKERRVSTRTD